MRISKQAKKEKRVRIINVAAELFTLQGFEEVTIRDIAKAVGMATGTLFNYFPSKETLAMEMVAEVLKKGGTDFNRRKTGQENLNEALYLFIACELRRLKPFHSFLGPVLERSFSPFPRKNICPVGELSKTQHLEIVQAIIARHGISLTLDHVTITLYWSLYLGILAFWVNDQSPNQQESQALIDYSLHYFVSSITGANNQVDSDG
jgi:AcrR family transcriptional regulator